VPEGIADVLRHVNPAFLIRCQNVGLLDEEATGYVVHDWYVYNPKDAGAAERQQRNRARAPQPQGGKWETARAEVFARDNGICLDCGKDCGQVRDGRDLWNADHEPPRDELIALGLSIYDIDYIYTRCHSCHAKKTRKQAAERRTGTEQAPNVDRTSTERSSVMFGASRAGAAARPVPYPLNPSPTPPHEEEENKNDQDQNRMQAWLDYAAQQPGITATLPYARKGHDTGAWPPQQQRSPNPSTECHECGERLGHGHADDCPVLASAAKRALAEHQAPA